MAPQPKLTVVNKVPNIPSVLLDLTQWIHTREAIVLRHAMTARAKVPLEFHQFIILMGERGRTGVGLGVGLGGRTGVGLGEVDWGSDWESNWRSDGGVGLGVGLEGSDWGVGLGSDWGRTGGRTGGGQIGGRTGGVGLGSDEVVGKISQVSL